MMEIIVETDMNPGEPSNSEIRVRPLPDQFVRPFRVWCSKASRSARPPPALFKVEVTLITQNGREPYLRIDPHYQWQVVTAEEAQHFIAQRRKVRADADGP